MKKEEIEEVPEVPNCDPATKPTMIPPGGSSQGFWDCDTKKKEWFWNDPIIAE